VLFVCRCADGFQIFFSSVALRSVDSNTIGMEQASNQGVSMIMAEAVVHPAQKQLLKITY
jgi:hypothetical protein